MSTLNKVTAILAACVISAGVLGAGVLVAAVSLPGCSAAEAQAIGADLENMATQVLADMLAGKGYAVLIADVGQGGANMLVTVIDFAMNDKNLSAADKAKLAAVAAPYLSRAKAEVAAQAH